MSIVPLTKGLVAHVDVTDFDWLMQFKWCALGTGNKKINRFNAARIEKRNGKSVVILMHRLIMADQIGRELNKAEVVDHKDHNPLNNHRDNLRVASRAQNQYNRRKNANNTSGYKGVWRSQCGSWRAGIEINGKHKHLGAFATAIEAARAYDQAATALHGDFANLNFPK